MSRGARSRGAGEQGSRGAEEQGSRGAEELGSKGAEEWESGRVGEWGECFSSAPLLPSSPAPLLHQGLLLLYCSMMASVASALLAPYRTALLLVSKMTV